MSSEELSNIEKANLANMLAKLKAGKVLTPTEERRLKEYQQRQEAEKEAATNPPKRTRKAAVFCVDQTALADFLGVTGQRVTQLVSEGIAVRTGRNRYDLRETGKRYIQSLKARQTGGRILGPDEGGEGTPQSLDAAKLQKVVIETKRAQLAYEKEQGAVISKASVEEAGVAIGALLCAELGAAENDLPGQIAGMNESTIRARLRARFDLMLTQLEERLASVHE